MKDSYKLIAFIILTQLAPQVGYAQLGWIWPSKRESPTDKPGLIDWHQLPKSGNSASESAHDSVHQPIRRSDRSGGAPATELFVATDLPPGAVDRGDSVVQHVFSDANAAPVIAASGSQADPQVKHIPWERLFEENESPRKQEASAEEDAALAAEASMIGPADEVFTRHPPQNIPRVSQPLAADIKPLGLITIQPEHPRPQPLAAAAPPATASNEPSLITDEFPEYVLQNLQASSEETQAEEEAVIPIDIMPFRRLATGEDMSVDGFYTVESMVGPMAGAETIFANLNIQDDFRDQAGSPLEQVRLYKDASGFGPEWPYQNYAWVSPTFAHAPLYFEQVNLERYGIGSNRYLQPVGSFVHFFGSVGLLPYKVFTQHPRERVYTLGHQRPGDCVAYQKRSLLGQSYPGEACKYFHDYSGYR